jgi:hypothetical protein
MSFQLLIKTAQPPGPVTGATAAWTSPNTYVSCSWTATKQYGGVPTITYTVVFYSSPTTNPSNGTIIETITGLSLSTLSRQTTTTLLSGYYYYAIIYAVNTARTSVGTLTNLVNPSFATISPPTNVVITWDQYNTYVSASWTASSGAVGYRVLFYSNPTNSTIGGTSFQTITTSSVSINTTNTLTLNTYYYVAVQALDSSGNYTAYATSPTAVLYYVLPVTNVSISYDANNTYVRASWTGINNALTVTYNISFYQTNSTTPSGGSLLQTITGLSVGTTTQTTTVGITFGNYYYAIVTAFELGVPSAPTTSATAVLYYLPFPTNFAMVWNGTSYVYATWTPVSFSLPIYYTINFYTSGGNVLSGGGLVQTFTNIGSGSNSQLTTTGLSYNQYYYATIYTTVSGTSSNSITVTTANNVYYYFAPPTNQSLAWTNYYNYLTATWSYSIINPAYTTLYNIFFYWVSANQQSGGTLVQTVLGTSNIYQNTTVTLSNGYYYAVINASNSVGTTSANVTTNTIGYFPSYWLVLGSGNNALTKSYYNSGISYTAGGNPFGSTGYAAAWNGSIWVAVGSATNTISWSSDGVTWNGLGTGIFNAQGRGVAWNGSLWVAVGYAGNTIAYSSTGTSWTGAGLVFSTVGYGIAWNGSTWVAVGQGAASIYTSANGFTWTASSNQSTAIFTTSANGGVWNGSIWVVGGTGTNTIATSVDGSIWINRGFVAGSTTVWCVAWSGTYFIAACAGTNPVMTSPDGITWTGRTATGLTVGYFITVQNSSIWVLSGQGTNTIFLCTDGTGVTWTARSANTVFTTCYSVCYNASFNYWVGVGTGVNSIAYSSTNGQTWTGASTLNSIIGVGYGVACDGGTWIAVGTYQSQGNFTMATSTNGSSWTGFAAAWNGQSVMQQLRSINYINGKYIVTGQGGAVYYANSLTSNAWISGAANPLFGLSTTVYNIAWSGSYYLAFSSLSGTVTVGLSPDLSSWASVAQIMFTIGWSITWNGSYFLATGQGNNTLARSFDGYGWRGLGLFCFPTVAYSSAWNSQNSVWVAVGTGGIASIWTSGDGYNFYPQTSMIYATTFNSVRYQYNTNMFTAVGTGGMIVRAYGTATQWQPTMQTAAWTNYNLTYGNGSWIASGASGFIVSSNVYETSNDGAPALTDWVPRSIYTIFTTQVNGFAWNNLWNYWLAFGTGTNSIAISMDGINWTAVLVSTTALTSGGYAGIWHSGLRLWIVGGLGTSPLVTSPDGFTWTVRAPGSLTAIYTIVTDGYLILIGGNVLTPSVNCFASSWDGVTWTNRNASSVSTCYKIIWDTAVLGSGQFIAVGGGTTYPINVSSNGITWTNNTSITTTQMSIAYDIAWASGFGSFVLVGQPGTTSIAVSGYYNLSAWSNYSGPYVINTLFFTQGYGVAWNGSYFMLAGGTSNSILYSPDGTKYYVTCSMAAGTSSPGGQIFTTAATAVIWNPNNAIWIACGSGNCQIAYGHGYGGWGNKGNSYFVTSGYCLATNNGRVICGGGAGGTVLWYTDNGTDWGTSANGTSIISSSVFAAAYGTNGIWVAGGQGAAFNLAYSYDGYTWVGASNFYGTAVTNITYCLAWNGSYFLAGGNSTGTYQFGISFNGSNWQMSGSIPFTTAARCLAWSGSIWVAGGTGTNTLAWSWNGVNWFGLGTAIFSSICYGVTWSGSIFVATGTGTNTIATSFDGSNWIPRGNYHPFVSYARAVAYRPDNNTIVIGGTGGSNTLTQTTDLVGYNYFGNTVFTTGCYAVAWNGSYFLAGGSGLNAIASSYDGYNWTGRANTTTSVAMRAAGWNGSYWIGVGAAGSVSPFYRSADTITWYQTTTYNPGTVYGVQWNGAYWLATSAATQVYQSYNGSFWIVRNTHSTPITSQVNAVIWNGSIWVALGSGTNSVSTSTNGFFWIGHGTYPFTTAGWAAAWNGSIWVATGSGTNTLAWSSNGSNWVGIGATIFTTTGFGVAWSPTQNIWVATGSGTNTIATSSTGLSNSWTARNTFIMQPGLGITWQGSYWVAVGQGTGAQIATSPDGLVWTATSSNTIFTTAVNGIAWNGSYFVAVGSANAIATSSDAINWTQCTFTGFTTGYGIVWAYNLGLWIVVGTGTSFQIGTSGDGVNWTGQNSNNVFTTAAQNAAWNGSFWTGVGLGTNSIVTSGNGYQWTPRGAVSATYFSTGGSNVIWAGALGLWVAVGTGTNAILTSGDGVTWTIRQLIATFGTGGYGVAYNSNVNTQLVAVGGATYWLQVSPDGSNWTVQNGSNVATTNMFALTSGPTGLMAVGNSATYEAAWSPDGWNWSNTAAGPGAAVQTQCATAINGYWIAGTTANLYYGTQNGSNNTAWTAVVGGNFYAATANSSIALATTTSGSYYWSSNGTTWTLLSNVFSYFSYMAYLNGLYVGTGSITGYSSNGITWYPSIALAYFGIAYGAGTYVIGGAGTNALYTSGSALSNSWTQRTSQLSTSTRFILWDPYYGRFLATGAGVNIFQYSGDGLTWTQTQATSNFVSTTVWFATYNNSVWTLVGGSGAANSVTVATTGDAVSFSQGFSNAFIFTFYSIAYSPPWNLYVAVGNQANTAYALYYANNPGLGGWTSNVKALGAGIYGYSVAWNGSYFCSVGGASNANLIYRTNDGSNWTLTSNTFSTVTFVRWTGWNLWIGVGTGSNAVAYSYDGVTWVGQGLNTWFTTGYGVAYGSGVALAVGTGTWQVIYTTDGVNWNGLSSSGVFTTAYAVAPVTNSNNFAIVGTGTYSIAYYNYGGTLTGVTNNTITTVKAVAYNGTHVLCANTTQLWYLNTGVYPYVWTNSGTAFATSAQAVSWNGSYFVAVGLSAIYYSSSGTSWTSTGSAALSYYSIAWNGSYWLAGYSSTTAFIAYSSSGTSAFTTGVSINGSMTIPYFLFWAPNINGGSGGWVATGSGAVTIAINYNTNGTGTWFTQGAPITTGYGIAYNPNNGVYMLVGSGTFPIYTSVNCSNWTGYAGTTSLMTTAYTVIYESASGSNIWCVGGTGANSFIFTTDQLGQRDWNVSYSNFRHTTTFFMVDSGGGPITVGNGPNIVYGGDYYGGYQSANTMFTTGYAVMYNPASYGAYFIAVGTGGSNTIMYNNNSNTAFAWSGAGILSLTTQGRGVAALSNNTINNYYPIIALGSGTYFTVISIDGGISWSPPPCTTVLYAVAWNGTYWSLGGTGGNTTLLVGTASNYPVSCFYGARCWSLFTSVYGVIWNGTYGFFVAVGQGTNTVAVSSDGVTWRNRGLFGTAMFAIAWNGTYFVMTGQTATYYSTDAYTWTLSTHPFTGVGYAVIWDGNNSRWMLGGNGTGTTIATTTLSPPTSWTAVAAATLMGTVKGLGWNGSYYVAVGNTNNTIAWAPSPGTSWTGLSTTYLSTSGYAVYWYNNAWIAVGSGTYNVAWSTNTINWFQPIFQTNLRGFGWNGSYWIGVGAGGTTLARASSWNNWSNINSNASYITAQGYTAVWNPNAGYWLACGTGTNTIVYSADGANWKVASTTTIFGTGCYGLAWNGSSNLWVAVGQGATFVTATSSDGLGWVGQGTTTSLFTAGFGITWNGTLWVAMGTAGTYSIAYSYNGTSWLGVPGSTSIFSTGYYVVWNGSYFVGVGTGTYCTAYSPDGINWFGKALAASLLTIAYGVAWNGTVWVAVGQPGQSTIAYSYDGNLWQASVNGLTAITTIGYAIQWNGSYFMMSGLNGAYPQVTYSTNGVTWSVYQYASFSNQSGTIFAITAGGNGLLAVGQPGVSYAAQSYEGLSWWNFSNVITPFSTLGTGAATNGSYIIATGTGAANSIAWSLDGTYWFGKGLLIAPSGSACNVAWNGSYWLIPTVYAQTTLPGFLVRTYDNSNYDYIGVPAWTAGWNITNIGGTFAAVGSNTSLRNPSYSTDGIGWVTRYSAQVVFTVMGTSVSSNNGIWIMTGTGTNSHAYAYLQNGPWNVFPVANFFSTGGYSVAWNGTIWVMVGQGTNTQITSSNGVFWIARGASVFSTAGYSINWNGSIFLATGTGVNLTAISTDGLNWDITGKLPFSTGFYIATNSNGLFVATGAGTITSNALAYSYDGLNWRQRVSSNTMFSTQGYSVVYNSTYNYWLAFGAGTNFIAKSLDGYNWFSQPWLGGQPYGIYYANGYFIAVGSGSNTMAYSSDGSNWYVSSNTNIFTISYCISWNANTSYWLAGGTGNFVSALSGGPTGFVGWTTNSYLTHSPFTAIYGIMWNQGVNNLWVAAGTGTYSLATSTDGSNWIGCVPVTTVTAGVTGMFVEFYNWSGLGIPNPSVLSSAGWGLSNSSATVASISYGSGGVTAFPLSSYLFVYASSYIFSPCSDTLYISVYTSDGVYINVNQGNILNAWSYQGINNYTTQVGISPGYNKVEIFYFNATEGSPTLRYFWQTGLTSGVTAGYTSNLAVASNSHFVTIPNASIFSSQGYAVGWNGSFWLAGGIGTNTIAMSYNGCNWFVQATTSLFATGCYAILWNGSYWVAGGQGTTVLAYGPSISSNTSNWFSVSTNAGPMFSTYVYCLGWNGSYWLAGGSGGTQLTSVSSNGSNWWPQPFPSSGYGVAYNGSYWVAVGSAGSTIITSKDSTGQTWFPTSSNALFTTAYAVAWSSYLNQWVVGGLGTYRIATSSDGITWTGQTSATAIFGTAVYCVAWNSASNVWLAGGVGVTYTTALSSDGVNWFGQMTTATLTAVWGVANNQYAGSNLWVATGTGGSQIAYSYNGSNWFAINSGSAFSTQGYGVAFSSSLNLWLAGGAGSFTTWTSQDGIWWFARTTNVNNSTASNTGQPILLTTACYGVTWSGTQFVAFGAGSPYTIATSVNGIAWFPNSNISYPTFSTCYAIGFGNGTYIGLGVGAVSNIGIAYSADAKNWTLKTFIPFTTSCTGVAWNGSIWVAVGTGTNTFCTSTDGVTWTPYGVLTQPFTGLAGGGAWNGSVWLAAGQTTNTIATSVDGNFWIGKTVSILSAGSNVLYAGGTFLTYGSSTNYQVNTTDLFNYNIIRKPDATTVYTLTPGSTGGVGLAMKWYQTTSALPNVVFPPDPGNGWGNLVYSGRTTQILYGDNHGGFALGGRQENVGMYAYGYFNSLVADVLYVYMVVDDGGYVTINGVNVLYAWYSQSATAYQGQANIPAGASLIQILFVNGGGPGVVEFYWQTNSSPGWKSDLSTNFSGSGSNGFSTMGTGGLAQPFYSSDGLGWYSRYTTNAITTTNVYTIISANGVFFMVGTQSLVVNIGIYYSADGYVWVGGAISGVLGVGIWSLSYINGVFVIGAQAGTNTFAISYDGFTWIPRTAIVFNAHAYALVLSGSYIYAAGAGSGFIAKTLDGINWDFVGSRVFTSSYGISWGSNVLVGSNLWVAVGSSNFVAGQPIAYSYDGIGWATRVNMNLATFSFFTTGYACIFVPSGPYVSYWLAVGSGTNKTLYSYDGLAWFPPAIPSGGQFSFWSGTYNIIGGSGAGTTLIYGTNGSNYRPGGTAAVFTKWWGIGYNGSLYVAVGTPASISYGNSNSSNTSIAYSTNLQTWLFAPFTSTIFGTGAYGITWSPALSVWVAVGQGGTFTTAISSNGSNWVGRGTTALFTTAGYSVVWNSTNNIFVAVGYGTGTTIATSANGSNWTAVATTTLWGASPAGGFGIAWNSSNNTYVAVGIATATMTNSIVYSLNGNATGWLGAGSNVFTTQGNGVAYNAASNLWVAVGSGTNTIGFSADNGMTWFGLSNSTSVFSTAGFGISWTGSLWVATGTGTYTLAWSSIGSNGWVVRTPIPFATAGYGVNTNGSTVVAGGQGTNSVAVSADGLFWAGFQLSVFPTNAYGVAYGNGSFLVSGATNIFAISSDGYVWDVVGARQLFTTGFGVAYNGSQIVAVGTGTTQPIIYSYDGVNWRTRVSYSGSTMIFPYSNANYVVGFLSNFTTGYGVCWNGNLNQWVAVGAASATTQGATIAFSPDGTNWFPTFSNLNYSSNIFTSQSLLNIGYSVVWTGTLYVAVGTPGSFSGGIAYSYNGSNWFGVNTSNFSSGRGVAWNGSYLIAVGTQNSSNYMFYSTDGINWEVVGCPIVTSGQMVYWNNQNNSFILLGTGVFPWHSILYSYDGIGWRSRIQTFYQFSTGYSVNCNYWAPSNANYFLAVGAGHLYMTSYEGINWYSPFSYGYGVSWNGSYFLAFGGFKGTLSSAIILSYDGFIWYNSRTGNQLFSTVTACLWNGSFGFWLATGIGTIVVAASSDGINWSPRVGANQFFGISGANGIVCSGSQWLVLGSTNGSPNTSIIIFSYNSYDWYSTVFATTANLFTVGAFAGIWNGSIYVVTGQGTNFTMATSPNGSNWFGQATFSIWSTATPAGGFAIAWNGGTQYVAVGYGPVTLTNTIVYSVNGSNWIGAGVTMFTTAGYGVIWVSQCNAFVATGAGTNSIAYSLNNGSNWTISTPLVLFTNGARGIAYDGTKFVATGCNGTSNIATSTDLFNWIGRSYYGGYTSAGTMATQYSVVWNANCNCWFSGGSAAQMLFYSMDGIMWLSNSAYTNYGNIGTAPGYALGCNGSYWIMAGGTGGNFYMSKDGFYWITAAVAPATNYQVMCNGGGFWGASGTSFSYDGISFCPVFNNSFTGFGIAYNQQSNRWVAVATTYTSVSVDGSNYFGSAFTTAGRAIFWDGNNSQFMAVGIGLYTQIIYGGAAGNYWYPSQTARQMINGAYGVNWNGSYYTVVGASVGTGVSMQWSTDRVTWRSCSNSYLVMSNMFGITYGYAGRWLIAGQGSNTVLAYTTDLVNYFRVAGSTLFTIGYGVYWNGSLFIAVGSAGSTGSYTIASSPDGITWTGRANNTLIATAYCVTWNGTYGLWVAGGTGGANCIATSPNGFDWTGRVTSSVFTTCYGVVWGIGGSTSGGGGPFGMFVAVGSGAATIATSFDGFTWTIRATSTLFSVAAYGVAFSGSVWVVVGGLTNTLATSSDGDNWMPWMTVPFSAGTAYAITYSSNYNIFVATGSGTNTLCWSYDGFIWQNTYVISGASNGTATFATQGWSIAWTPNAMVASGIGNNVFATTAQGQSNWRAYSNALLESTGFGVATNG